MHDSVESKTEQEKENMNDFSYRLEWVMTTMIIGKVNTLTRLIFIYLSSSSVPYFCPSQFQIQLHDS